MTACVAVYLSTCLPGCRSICLPACLFFSMCDDCLPICQSDRLCACESVCDLYVGYVVVLCGRVCMFARCFVCLPIYVSLD